MAFSMTSGKKTTARDMTEGSIIKQLVLFALPLMLGNVFQMMYNTVDSIVVGNYVGKQALAAVGSTTMIVNMMVFFFNGFSTGAGVVISHDYGARNMERLHKSIETTMALTFLFSIFFTVAGVLAVDFLLNFMSTPEDVFGEASTYLTIYIGGISGLLVYNMGSGILRAVGDTTRPLYFLVLTSLVNITLDLFFVIKLKMGIAGVAYATIIAQFISAILIMVLLCRTGDIYRFSWRDLQIDLEITKQIFSVGLPAGIQSVITAFSNVFVQSYINFFGSSAMAGWSSYNKLDQFIMLPMQSMAMAATTFVSQNCGARKEKRADRGTVTAILLTLGVTSVIVVFLYIFAEPAVRLFIPDESVIRYGVLFIYANTIFFLCNCVNHVLAGALRGKGDSRGPMVIMITCFVVVRQAYLYLVTHYVANTPLTVCLAYPVGWTTCCITEVIYFFYQRKRKQRMLPAEETE